jgi:metallo-beta-lactamase family protein
LWNKKASIVFVGYQAEGTLGRLLVEGAEEVTLFGEKIQVNAEIHNLEGFSGHADRDGLLEWLSGFQQERKHIFLVHGEAEAKEAFAVTVKEKLGYEPIVVRCNSEYVLEKDEIVSMNDAIREEVDTETIDSARNTLSGIHRKIEDILYNANLAIDESLSTEQLIRINNIIQELEKSTINLGAAVTEENRTAK